MNSFYNKRTHCTEKLSLARPPARALALSLAVLSHACYVVSLSSPVFLCLSLSSPLFTSLSLSSPLSTSRVLCLYLSVSVSSPRFPSPLQTRVLK